VLSAPKRFPYVQFQMHIRLAPGQTYQVQAGTDLRHWTTLLTDAAQRSTVEYLDNSAANFSFRYYRVLSGELCSSNVVGYATVTVPPGFAMLANPLMAESNTIDALFPNLPKGTTLTKFDTHLFKLTKNVFDGGKWSNPGDTLLPGEGAILFNPSADFKTLRISGEVQQGELSIPIPAGFSVRSSPVPVPGQLDTDLQFPAAEDDVVHLFDRDRQRYTVYAYNGGKWTPEPPILAVGESFWVGKTFAGNWSRTLLLDQLEVASQAIAA